LAGGVPLCAISLIPRLSTPPRLAAADHRALAGAIHIAVVAASQIRT